MINKYVREYRFDGSKLFWFPGIFFLMLGLLTVLAPKFVLTIIALSFLVIGGFLMVLAWKMIQMKKKFEGIFNNFQKNGFEIKGVQVVDYQEEETKPNKNVILH